MANANGGPKVTPLEMEPLNGDDTLASSNDGDQPKAFVMPDIVATLKNLWILIVAHASHYRHILMPVATVAFIIIVILMLNVIVYSTTQRHVASVTHDYSESKSTYDLKMQQIDHWCLSGGDDDCRCDDPTIPMSKGEAKGWAKAHKKNKQLVSDFDFMSNIDMVMLGDQTMEEWNGRWYGNDNDQYKGMSKAFKKLFTKSGGGSIDAVSLGIAEDSVTNLLWRLQHGELPDALDPKMFWIMIGGNDLARGQCSEEVTLLGILRLVEYVFTERPNSIVVINSIMPSTTQIKPQIKHVHFKSFDVFPSIQVVNEQLAKFAKKRTRIHFFDSTNLFFSSPPPSPSKKKKHGDSSSKHHHSPTPKSDLIDKYGQLTVAGHKKWGDAVVVEANRILAEEVYDEQFEAGLMDDMFNDDLNF